MQILQRQPYQVFLDSPGVVFFIRHGQCRSNIEWPILDYNDDIDPLTEKGKKQAIKTGFFLKEILPDFKWRVYSSTLLRAIQTAELVSEIGKFDFVGKDDRINEFDSINEDHDVLSKRIDSFRKEISMSHLDKNERILVVTHGFVLSSLLCTIFKTNIQIVNKGEVNGQNGLSVHANAGLSAFHDNDLVCWNHHFHLLNDEG